MKKVKFDEDALDYDDMEGGAIDQNIKFSEVKVRDPERDYRDVIQDESFLYEGSKWEFFRDAFDYRPLNIVPMYAYEPLLQSKNEEYTKEHLKRGLSGLGASKDPVDVRRATHHTLKRHPEILDVYMRGSV